MFFYGIVGLQLNFSVTSESAPAKELKVDLMGSDAERFTSTTYFCEIPMKDTSLNEMIQHLQKEAQSDSQQGLYLIFFLIFRNIEV